MIICQCQSISDHDVRNAVAWMRASDPDTIVTPGKVFHALGKRPVCGCCAISFINTLRASLGFAAHEGNSGMPIELLGLRKKDLA